MNGRSTFNGNSASESTSTVQARSTSGNANSDSTTRSYIDLVSGASQFKLFGTSTQATASGFSISTTVTFEPFRLQRFDLSAGESYTQTYTIKTQSNFGSAPDQTVTSRVTFVGVERISVPAGSFEACRFLTEDTIGSNTASSTTWIATGSGTSIKTVSGNTESVLVSGSTNGMALTGN